MELSVVRHGAEAGVPLVVAHGLFGSAKNLGAVARRLGEGRPVVAADLRNHGGSGWDPDHSYAAMAGDLAELVAGLGGRADVLGHSMGGKAAMVLALSRPEAVRRLVVADIAPVAYAHTQMPLLEAMRDLDLAGVTRRGEAERRLAARVEDRGVRAFLLQSLVFEDGQPVWRLNLDALAANMPGIMGFPDLPGRFDGPALFLRGGASDYVRPEHTAAIRARFPAARIETLEAVGHWLHAEAPEAFVAAVAGFLDG